MMTSNSRLQGQGTMFVGKSTAWQQCGDRRQRGGGSDRPMSATSTVKLDAGGAVAKNLSNNGSIHGLPRGWVVKLEIGGGDADVTHSIGPQIVRVEHAMHTAVFVGDGCGAISANE